MQVLIFLKQFLVSEWQGIPTIILWSIDLNQNRSLYWIYIIIHAFSWLTVYGGSVIMDLPELTGVKQVSYCRRDFVSRYLINNRTFFFLDIL